MPDLPPILSQKCRVDVIRLSFWLAISRLNKIGMDGFNGGRPIEKGPINKIIPFDDTGATLTTDELAA